VADAVGLCAYRRRLKRQNKPDMPVILETEGVSDEIDSASLTGGGEQGASIVTGAAEPLIGKAQGKEIYWWKC
jgi:hypothetical protein